MSRTNTQLFTLLALTLDVKRHKYLKMVSESERKWVTRRPRDDFLLQAVCGQCVLLNVCLCVFLESILRYFSCCQCDYVSLTQVMDHLFVTGCGCSPQGKEREKPSERDPQGRFFTINQATLLKVIIKS